jgi:hypothetical protein
LLLPRPPPPILPNLRELQHLPHYHLPQDLLLNNKYKPAYIKPLDKMKNLLEVILEEAHQVEEDNQEADQLPQLPKFQYLLLPMFGPWEPYLKSSVEIGPKPSTL